MSYCFKACDDVKDNCAWSGFPLPPLQRGRTEARLTVCKTLKLALYKIILKRELWLWWSAFCYRNNCCVSLSWSRTPFSQSNWSLSHLCPVLGSFLCAGLHLIELELGPKTVSLFAAGGWVLRIPVGCNSRCGAERRYVPGELAQQRTWEAHGPQPIPREVQGTLFMSYDSQLLVKRKTKSLVKPSKKSLMFSFLP